MKATGHSTGRVSRAFRQSANVLTIFAEIDISIQDALKRKMQTATIQLDFNLPIQFKLAYRSNEVGSEGTDERVRPVMIHRAVIGSFERFMALITEHFGGKW